MFDDFMAIFCCIPAGISTSHVVANKIQTSQKTGVLNLVDTRLSSTSTVWQKLGEEDFATKIKSLDISGNLLEDIPTQINSMRNIKTLHAARCHAQRLLDLSRLDKLTVLTLDKNDLTEADLAPLPTSLSRIDMSSNQLSAFPAVMRTLVSLVELNLANNRIDRVTGIGDLVALVTLHLSDNRLCELPEEMSRLVKLRQIYLNNNRIAKIASSHDGQSIPAAFFVHTQVDSIHLGGNPGLLQSYLLDFDGIQEFIDRRKKSKDKSFQGGALTEFGLFGLE